MRAGAWQGSRVGSVLRTAQPDDAARRALARLPGEGDGTAGENITDKALRRVLVPAARLDQVNRQVSYLVGGIASVGVEVNVLAEDKRVGGFADSRDLVGPQLPCIRPFQDPDDPAVCLGAATRHPTQGSHVMDRRLRRPTAWSRESAM